MYYRMNILQLFKLFISLIEEVSTNIILGSNYFPTAQTSPYRRTALSCNMRR